MSESALVISNGSKGVGPIRPRAQKVDVEDSLDRDDTIHSTCDDINIEIRRMTRDADLILESIRNEAASAVSTSSTRRPRRNVVNQRTNTKSTTEKSSSAVVISDVKAQSLRKEEYEIDDIDDSNSDDDDEDDDLLSEIQRLDLVAAAIRESLDVDENDIQKLPPSSPLILGNKLLTMTIVEDEVKRMPLPKLSVTLSSRNTKSVDRDSCTHKNVQTSHTIGSKPVTEKSTSRSVAPNTVDVNPSPSLINSLRVKYAQLESIIIQYMEDSGVLNQTKYAISPNAESIVVGALILIWTTLVLLFIYVKWNSTMHNNGSSPIVLQLK